MIKEFGRDGPGGPGGPGKPGTLESPGGTAEHVGFAGIARVLTPAFSGRGVRPEQTMFLSLLVAEALQALEHASLVRVSWRGGMEDYLATRPGRAAAGGRTPVERGGSGPDAVGKGGPAGYRQGGGQERRPNRRRRAARPAEGRRELGV